MNRPEHRWSPDEARSRGASGGKTGGKLRQRIKQLEKDLEFMRRRLDAEPDKPEDYLQKRVERIRLQLDRYDDMLLDERDPQKAQWLATVTAKLAEQERIISGRPNPGHLRPSPPSRRQAPKTIVPE